MQQLPRVQSQVQVQDKTQLVTSITQYSPTDETFESSPQLGQLPFDDF